MEDVKEKRFEAQKSIINMARYDDLIILCKDENLDYNDLSEEELRNLLIEHYKKRKEE